MSRQAKLDVVLVAVAALAVCLTMYFGARYGDVFRIGDSQYRRTALSDQLRIVLSGAVAMATSAILALRRLSGGGIVAQWRRERAQLEEARAWDGSPWT